MLRRLIAVAALPLLLSCGGGSGTSSTPTTPTPTVTQSTNRAPQINSLTVSPSFGIAYLTTFDYSAAATDPDGDPITYTWDLAGNARTGNSGQIAFTNGFSGTFRVTATDSKGATATDTRSITVGSATGTWRGTWSIWVFTSNLTQNAGLISGDYSDQDGPGRLDPAVANTIDANGNVRLRYKQATFSDFIFTGTMDSTGRRITGVVNGSGASNVPFTMTKQ